MQTLHTARNGDGRQFILSLLPVGEDILLHDLTSHITRCLTSKRTCPENGVKPQLGRVYNMFMTRDDGIAFCQVGFNALAACLLQEICIFM